MPRLPLKVIAALGGAKESERAEKVYHELKSLATGEHATPEIRLAWAMGAFNLISALGDAKEFERAEKVYHELKGLATGEHATPEIRQVIDLLDRIPRDSGEA